MPEASRRIVLDEVKKKCYDELPILQIEEAVMR